MRERRAVNSQQPSRAWWLGSISFRSRNAVSLVFLLCVLGPWFLFCVTDLTWPLVLYYCVCTYCCAPSLNAAQGNWKALGTFGPGLPYTDRVTCADVPSLLVSLRVRGGDGPRSSGWSAIHLIAVIIAPFCLCYGLRCLSRSVKRRCYKED